jgi:ferric-dicitrate binding protein FerR (iron transport regulator)
MEGDPGLRDEFVRIQNSWALVVSSGDVNDAIKAGRYLHEFKKRHNRKKAIAFLGRFTKYAAIFAVGMFIAWNFLHKPRTEDKPAQMYQKLTVPAGQRAHLTLSDGTTVWVNAKSTLEYPGTFTGDTRELTLTGEAYFDVADNPALPFVVKSGNFRTRVTGTQFNVFAYESFFEVSLVEGSVSVYKAGADKNAILLNRNEKVTLANGQLVKKLSLNTDDFLWKEGIYYFDDMPFSAIVEKLQLYYDVQIHVSNKALLKHRFTGKFRQRDGIETVLKVIRMGYPFAFSKSEDGSNIFIK